MRLQSILTTISMIIFAMVKTAVSVCRDKSVQLGHDACVLVRPVPEKDQKRAWKLSPDDVAQICRKYGSGEHKWQLPKLETAAKRRQVAAQLMHHVAEQWLHGYTFKPNGTSKRVGQPGWFWLGLRRREPYQRGQMNEDDWWYWTADDSKLTQRPGEENFWDHDSHQPDHGGSSGLSEECAMAGFRLDGSRELAFYDMPCNGSRSVVGLWPVVTAIVCTVSIAASQQKSKSILDKWWFIFVCILAILVLVSVVGVGIALFAKRRRCQRETVTGDRPDSPVSIGADRKKKWQWKSTGQHKNAYEKYSFDNSRSRTLESFSDGADAKASPKSSVFDGSKCEAGGAKMAKVGACPAKKSSLYPEDQEEHEYSNVRPPVRRPEKSLSSMKTKMVEISKPKAGK